MDTLRAMPLRDLTVQIAFTMSRLNQPAREVPSPFMGREWKQKKVTPGASAVAQPDSRLR